MPISKAMRLESKLDLRHCIYNNRPAIIAELLRNVAIDVNRGAWKKPYHSHNPRIVQIERNFELICALRQFYQFRAIIRYRQYWFMRIKPIDPHKQSMLCYLQLSDDGLVSTLYAPYPNYKKYEAKISRQPIDLEAAAEF